MAHPLVELLFAASADDHERPSRDVRHVRLTPGEAPSRTGAELVERIREGNVAVFREVYLETFRELWSFARRYVGSAAIAEEVVQDVFLRVWERRDTWVVHGSVRAYLFGAVRNHALHVTEHDAVELRARGVVARERIGHSEEHADDPFAEAEERELQVSVERALATLPERQRAAMLLRLRHELSYAQIGEALGIAAAVAGRLVVKGERKLRDALRGTADSA